MKILAAMRDAHSGSRLQKIVPYLERGAQVRQVFVGLSAHERALNRLRSFAPSRLAWGLRSKNNAYYFRSMSESLVTSVKAHSSDDFDVLLMFEALYSPGLNSGRVSPYVIYDDCTVEAALRHWPAWVPATARTAAYRKLLVDYYSGASRILTSNTVTRDSLMNDYGVAPTRVVCIGQGCDWNADGSDSPPVVEGQVLFVGFEFERKGGRVLLEAFRRVRQAVPHATLILVGPSETVRDPGVTVVRPGHDKAVLQRLYRQSSVFVLPSFFDPMPNAAMEAMALGVPTVVADGCGTVEIIADGRNGIVVPAGNAEILAARLIQLLSQPAYRAAIGSAGAETLKELTWERVARNVRQTLTEVLDERSNTSLHRV